jgi:APA family basic amino acid/polyamine antiporter
MLYRKPLEALREERDATGAMPRLLGFRSLTALSLSGLIGTGIFIMTGMAAHLFAGPALIVSFLIAGVACIAAALCYAEFAALVPFAGSAYTYAYVTLGEAFAWLVGWNLLLQYGLAAASVAQGWSHYFQSLIGSVGIHLPVLFTGAPLDLNATGRLAPTGALLDLPALLAVVALTAIVIRGLRLSLTFNNVLLGIKLAVIAFVVLVGARFIHPGNWTPFAPYGWSGISLFGHTVAGRTGPGGAPVGVLAGAALVFYAYMGFDAITNYTEETRRPQRNLPLAIIASVLIATLLYVAVTAVVTGMVRYDRIDLNAPISEAFRQAGLPWAQFLVALGATIGITSVLFAILMGFPRILLAIGRDGLISRRFFTALHPRYQTPWKSSLVICVNVGLLAALMPLQVLMNLVIMGTLFGYVLISAAVLVMRRTHAGMQRPFRAPGGPFIPLLSIVGCGGLMLTLPPIHWLHLGVWLLAGAILYLLYRKTAQ